MGANRSLRCRTNIGYTLGFITFVRLGNILRLARYLLEMHPRYALRALLIGASSLGSLPLRLLEAVCYGREISRVKIDKAPVYEVMMQRFLADRDLIPKANFAEVRFEDLERDPLGELGACTRCSTYRDLLELNSRSKLTSILKRPTEKTTSSCPQKIAARSSLGGPSPLRSSDTPG